MVTKKEVIVSASGKTEQGHTKSAFLISLDKFFSKDRNKIENISKVLADEPIVNISENIGYTEVELIYKSFDEMKKHYELLNDGKNAINQAYYDNFNSDDAFTAVTLTIVPHEYQTDYIIVAFAPIFYTLAPDLEGNVNSIKLLFEADTVEVYANEEN